MKTIYAVQHFELVAHDFIVRVEASLLRASAAVWEAVTSPKRALSRAVAVAWDAITSTGPKHDMPLSEMERYVSEAADPEDEARRLRAWDEHVSRMRGFPPRF